jgi:elongation of very long chain fatty acids protein 6
MYVYYYLQAAGSRPGWGVWVTALQLSQMVVGLAVTASAIGYKWGQGRACDVTDENLAAGLAMYASYAALFAWFALNRYVWRGRAKGTPAKEE